MFGAEPRRGRRGRGAHVEPDVVEVAHEGVELPSLLRRERELVATDREPHVSRPGHGADVFDGEGGRDRVEDPGLHRDAASSRLDALEMSVDVEVELPATPASLPRGDADEQVHADLVVLRGGAEVEGAPADGRALRRVAEVGSHGGRAHRRFFAGGTPAGVGVPASEGEPEGGDGEASLHHSSFWSDPCAARTLGAAVASSTVAPLAPMLRRPMRLLHVFEDSRDAETLANALLVEEIEATVRETRDGGWALWVHDEARMEPAKALLEEFLRVPDAPKFLARQREAEALRREREAQERARLRRARRVQEALARQHGPPRVTYGLIGLSVAMYVLTLVSPESIGLLVPRMGGDALTVVLRSLGSGEPWRLVAPIFIHGGLLHLLFNMLWLRDLGTVVERALSPWRLLAMTFVFGVGGVLAELYVGGLAVGMSGVVYGLFAYLWVRGRLDPSFGYGIDRRVAMWMLGWYVLCFFPGLRIANGAHTAGLVLGALWGFAGSGYLRRRLRA